MPALATKASSQEFKPFHDYIKTHYFEDKYVYGPILEILEAGFDPEKTNILILIEIVRALEYQSELLNDILSRGRD
ncbi:MAG: hypothetical protein Q7U77_15265 [Sediminibacterium sp.]|uniref:hypothetical protein n=1 Tax=Sediminibacterium sp. TaxID=1917865 RepID=UPI0027168263|nr:hypothetical protein [Sediminibacterium sp.]MDO8997979.1 hypothetical protein [Sediminibacterium sp.]